MPRVNRINAFAAGFMALAAVVKPAMGHEFLPPAQETPEDKNLLACMRAAADQVGAKVIVSGIVIGGLRKPFTAPSPALREGTLVMSDGGVYARAYMQGDNLIVEAAENLDQKGEIGYPKVRVYSSLFPNGSNKYRASEIDDSSLTDPRRYDEIEKNNRSPLMTAARSVAELFAPCMPGYSKRKGADAAKLAQ